MSFRDPDFYHRARIHIGSDRRGPHVGFELFPERMLDQVATLARHLQPGTTLLVMYCDQTHYAGWDWLFTVPTGAEVSP